MDVADWEGKLRSAFGSQGRIAENLSPVLQAEVAHDREQSQQFKGQKLLVECFQQFFLEIFSYVDKLVVRNGLHESYSYRSLIGRHKSNFQCVRASQVTFCAGYGYHAFALLRGIRENTIQICGLISGLTTEAALAGLPLEENPSLSKRDRFERAKERGRKAESELYAKLLGAKSSLPDETKDQLYRLKSMFDDELHRFRLSQTDDIGWYRGDEGLTIGPSVEIDGSAMYMNRLNELSWMMLRTFPSLQLSSVQFPAEWANKWRVLDECLKVAVESLTTQLGKEIGVQMSEFIQTKFAFDPTFHFSEKK